MLRPLQTYLTMIVPHEHLSQVRTLKLHINLCNSHHRGRVTTLQSLRATIVLPKNIPQKKVILEAAKTTYALFLTLFTQKYTENDMCKILFQPLSCAIPNICFYFFHLFRTQIILFFLFWGRIHINQKHQLKLTEWQHPNLSIQFKSRRIRSSTRRTKLRSKNFRSNSLRGLAQMNAASVKDAFAVARASRDFRGIRYLHCPLPHLEQA